MIKKRFSKNRLVRLVFGCLFAIISIFGIMALPMSSAYAEPESQTTVETTTETTGDVSCEKSLGAVAWLVCPSTGKIAKAVDWLYDKIENILVINPVEMKDGTPIYEVWKYARGITNIVFIILLLVVVYSQLTGVGISNYGVKKILPKLIIVAILVNLSFIICSLAVDLSNIIGSGLRGLLTSVEESAMTTMQVSDEQYHVTVSQLYGLMTGALSGGILAAWVAVETGAIFMLIPVVLGAIVAVVSGLITIAMRQAVVVLLIMIAPLAIVAYILPNTEKWFGKWKDLFIKMLVFYPMFSLLFGASSLAGGAIIASSKDSFGLILGIAVKIFPLFFSWSLMKMSGTFLATVNAKINGLAAAPLVANRAWAESRRNNARANTLANGVTPSARLMQFLDKRRALREEDTKNALEVASGKTTEYVQRKIADSEVGDLTTRSRRASRYTRNAKAARNYKLIGENATSHTDHVLNHYGSYFNIDARDKALGSQSERAWLDYGRSMYQKEMDEEDDINFLVDKYIEANRRDANNNPVDEEAFNRYIKSVAGPNGEQRLMAKVIKQAATVESKQRAEYSVLYAKYGHNGFNKSNFRDFIAGYRIDDDGWAVDVNGERLRNSDGSYVEIVQGDAITKAPEKLVLYNKRDANGLYYDFKDQNGNIIARVHRGIGADGQNHDDAAFIKETLANFDIPIADPINNVYGILAGIKPNEIVTPQGQNEIGLARYSTTIGRAMSEYKGNAAWAGSMFNSGIGNRQITNSAQYAIWVLDSIKKTLKPGAFNTQNPASVEYLTAILNPDNWDKIFTEEELTNAVNINNELFGGEDWELNENGEIVGHTAVENPTYEQRMNTLKRKLLFPAMKKILPALDRLRTSNTADNQKPGTADAQYEFLKMVEDRWENNDDINFDPTLVDQDLQSAARAFRQRKHDKRGNLIYDSATEHGNNVPANLLNTLEEAYDRYSLPSELRQGIFGILNRDGAYRRALERFEELCNENPDATMEEMRSWFDDLATLVNYS